MTPERERAYNTYLRSGTWKHIRRDTLKRNAGFCEICNELRARVVHHLTYARFGGRELPTDLQSLCDICHDSLHSRRHRRNMSPPLQAIQSERQGRARQANRQKKEIRRRRKQEATARRALQKKQNADRRWAKERGPSHDIQLQKANPSGSWDFRERLLASFARPGNS